MDPLPSTSTGPGLDTAVTDVDVSSAGKRVGKSTSTVKRGGERTGRISGSKSKKSEPPRSRKSARTSLSQADQGRVFEVINLLSEAARGSYSSVSEARKIIISMTKDDAIPNAVIESLWNIHIALGLNP